MFRRSATVLAGSLVVVAGLSGCSLLEAGGGEEPLTGVAACALGSVWQLDAAETAARVKADLAGSGVISDVEITGNRTLDWNEKGHVLLDSEFVMKVTVPLTAESIVTVVQTYAGEATGAAYITGDIAIPRRWDGDNVTLETVVDNSGAPMEGSPWAIPSVAIDDSVGLQITCDGDTLTIQPRGDRVAQIWTRAGESTAD